MNIVQSVENSVLTLSNTIRDIQTSVKNVQNAITIGKVAAIIIIVLLVVILLLQFWISSKLSSQGTYTSQVVRKEPTAKLTSAR